MAPKKLTYQDAMLQLQALCDQLKADSIPLEALPEEIRKARALITYCQEMLRSVESELDQKK